jgi:hypothetical protein
MTPGLMQPIRSRLDAGELLCIGRRSVPLIGTGGY